MTTLDLSRARRARAVATLAALSLAVVAVACNDVPFEHSNPIDPESTMPFTIVGGIDTLRVTGANLFLSVAGAEGKFASWESNNPRLVSMEGGNFSPNPTLQLETAVVTATVGARSVQRTFVLEQRAANIDVTCAGPANCGDTLRSFAIPLVVFMSGTATDGQPLQRLQWAIDRGTVVSRNPAVVTALPRQHDLQYHYQTAGNGTTWLVVSIDGARDSVRFVVKQRVSAWTNACPTPVQVGQTLQLTTTAHVDANGRLITSVTDSVSWTPGFATHQGDPADLSGEAIVTPSGSITGVSPGLWATYSSFVGSGQQEGCVVRIVP